MKTKILKIELAIQLLIILASLVYYFFNVKDGFFIIFTILPILAVSNFIGFLVRIFTIKSKFMMYYFFIVLIFFLSLYIFGSFLNLNDEFFMLYLIIISLLISLYYTLSGFYLIKDLK
ncbi:hypothetical protein SAMN05443292_0753 [Halpernia frigidisoli]|uniref:Uncharacterized protein n=1 Tax=Halpernia frigidisoli TaxID=1125876 RepID=A0A1I3DX31_9FLAO|nr:hypothetical protein SAMN05443292_0753 [Halpernia frigidisoli]